MYPFQTLPLSMYPPSFYSPSAPRYSSTFKYNKTFPLIHHFFFHPAVSLSTLYTIPLQINKLILQSGFSFTSFFILSIVSFLLPFSSNILPFFYLLKKYVFQSSSISLPHSNLSSLLQFSIHSICSPSTPPSFLSL